jgi:CRISPR-associated endonuclease/helicase Cas3
VRPERLLAKSSATPANPRQPELLPGHTSLVMTAARQLLEYRMSDALHAAGLDNAQRQRLERWVLVGAFVHDLGKASDHAQASMRHERDRPQLLRHEACSLYLAWPGQVLGKWLLPAVGDARELCFALIAAAGHHRKFWRDAIAPGDSGAGQSLTLWTSHEDFEATLRLAVEALGLATPPPLADLPLHHGRRSELRAFFARCEEHATQLRPTREERRLLAIAKALVLDADVAGSALPKAGQGAEWIGAALSRRRDPVDLEALVEQRLDGRPLRPFQAAVAASREPVTLIHAGCGTGKTVAAYLWAARSYPGRTLWVTYPTTGTATEGFRDYLYEAPMRGRLEHGRASIDIQMFGLEDGAQAQRELDRLDAIRAWEADVVTCTVDTVLGLIQNQRKGLYAFPSLCRGAVVFDEIHAYDDELFGAMLRFLRALPGVPVLLMTASLPDGRRLALAESVREVHQRPMAVVDGPFDLESLPRYRRCHADPWRSALDVIGRGGRVLWVSNTVERCMAVGARGLDFGLPALIYHSRFRYEDRVARHGAVVDAFKSQAAGFASTTQVAEMSFDLSSDLLVTDHASIPALIQRLGRLNRDSRPDAPRPVAPFIVIEPNHALPYDEAELAAAREWLAHLGNRELSQRDLIEAWRTSDEPAASPCWSAWLDGFFRTEPAALRDLTPGITVIRAQDSLRVKGDPGAALAVALPMDPPPRGCGWKTWPRAASVYPVAPAAAIDYDPTRGARWRK